MVSGVHGHGYQIGSHDDGYERTANAANNTTDGRANELFDHENFSLAYLVAPRVTFLVAEEGERL
jgi:hypothetical protein